MLILTLNLRQGGGSRIPQLSAYLLAQKADLLCLTEFRHGPRGDRFIRGLGEAGYHCIHTPSPTHGVLLAVRNSLSFEQLPIPASLRQRACFAEVAGIRIAGIYFPQKAAKRAVFDDLGQATAAWLGGPALLLGDFNTGKHLLDETGKTFHCVDSFEALLDRGWLDVFRRLHPDRREYSWFSQVGNGFRIDHAFGSPAVVNRVTQADYDHAPRLQRWSDHAALRLQLAEGKMLENPFI